MKSPPAQVARCPFCGRIPEVLGLHTHNGSGIAVQCNCAASGPLRKTAAGAIRAWNRVAGKARGKK